MKKTAHRFYITTLVLIVIATLVILSVIGFEYYATDLTERFYHPDHDMFKASGTLGHGIGILGTLLIVIGVFGYMARKRYRFLSRLGLLKHWLEFHIFLCTEGAILILFHTSFKFGGLVSISFWSMVAVVLSGIIGRFIYIQIPRTIEGRALNLEEAVAMRMQKMNVLAAGIEIPVEVQQSLEELIKTNSLNGSDSTQSFFSAISESNSKKSAVKKILSGSELPGSVRKEIFKKVIHEINLNRKIKRLEYMQKLFKYWHVAHLPFALIMLVIAVIHVAVTLIFGYKWIF